MRWDKKRFRSSNDSRMHFSLVPPIANTDATCLFLPDSILFCSQLKKQFHPMPSNIHRVLVLEMIFSKQIHFKRASFVFVDRQFLLSVVFTENWSMFNVLSRVLRDSNVQQMIIQRFPILEKGTSTRTILKRNWLSICDNRIVHYQSCCLFSVDEKGICYSGDYPSRYRYDPLLLNGNLSVFVCMRHGIVTISSNNSAKYLFNWVIHIHNVE